MIEAEAVVLEAQKSVFLHKERHYLIYPVFLNLQQGTNNYEFVVNNHKTELIFKGVWGISSRLTKDQMWLLLSVLLVTFNVFIIN